MIYLDHAATTAVYDSAVESMTAIYKTDFFNPSATYWGGRKVKETIENCRKVLAARLCCNKDEVYFTSCATEANNWALTSGFRNKKGNIVVSGGEHACVYETAKNLQSKGYEVRFVPLQEDGSVNPADVAALVDDKTNLVSVLHVSNETGVTNDLSAISKAIKAKNPRVLFHSDGVQAFLKVNNSVKLLGVDCYSISGHKIGAPKGIGAAYLKSGVHLAPYLYGGGQEKGLRSGTENVGGIVGLSAAVNAFLQEFNPEKLNACHQYLVRALQDIPQTAILGSVERSSKFIVCAAIEGVRAETLQSVLSDKNIYVGRGSACSSRHGGNRVLSQMGVTQSRIEGAIRISFSPSTTVEELEVAVAALKEAILQLRGHKVG